MTKGNVKGEVSAIIRLDTSEFKSAIEDVKRQVKSLNSDFKSVNVKSLVDDINTLKNESKKATRILTSIKTSIKSLGNAITNGSVAFNKFDKEIDESSTKLNKLKKEINTSNSSAKKFSEAWKNTSVSFKRSMDEISTAMAKFSQVNYTRTRANYLPKTYSNNWDLTTNQLKNATKGLTEFNRQLDLTREKQRLAKSGQFLNTNQLKTASTALNIFNSQLKSTQSKLQHFKRLTSQNIYNTKDLANATQGFKALNIHTKSTPVNLKRIGQQIQAVNNNFNATTSQLKRASQSLQLFNRQARGVGVAFNPSNHALKTAGIALNTFERGLKSTSVNLNKVNTQTRNSTLGFKSMGSGMNNVAHSGRILSNTLYQIRGALLSLKMIFTAMGGMMLWGFAMDIAEGVKTTLTAKSEIETQLKQNKNVDSYGIEYFNQALDNTAKKFQKINKYTMGETISSIGTEFDLNAKQMAESMDIVSMVTSEYIRAGRKSEEAALAVKDILQGEFLRLSRETGIGKKELIAYGWNGENKDVESLMKALRKAAKDRHWELFATKATSLNDVLTITKSRFSETGADILDNATPLIVGAFNILTGAIENIQGKFNSLNSFQQNFIIGTTFMGSVTGILTLLPMLIKGMGLVDIATIGWSKSLLTTALNLNKMEVAQYGFRKALAATIAGVKASEIANVRASKAILGRILGVNQGILAERGLKSAIFNKNLALRQGLDLNKTSINLGKASIINMEKMTITEMTRAQKLAYLTNNIDLNTAAQLKQGQAIKKVATSWRIWRVAMLGVVSIGAITYLANLASQLAFVKKTMDTFNKVASSGKDMLKDAKKSVQDYTTALTKLTKGTEEYNRTQANLEIAKATQKDITQANKLVKVYKKQNKERDKEYNLAFRKKNREAYLAAGFDYGAATEKATGYSSQIILGGQFQKRADDERRKSMNELLNHLTRQVIKLKEAGVEQKNLTNFIDEYTIEAEKASNYLNKFYEGDMNSGAYYLLSRLKLAWIEISNHPNVVILFRNLGKAWEEFQPTLGKIVDGLSWIGLKLVDLANWISSTKMGRWALMFTGLAGGIGLAALKLRRFLPSGKSVIDFFRNARDGASKLIDKFRNLGKTATDTGKKLEESGMKSETGTSTSMPKEWKKGEFKKTLGNDAKNIARSYFKVATHLALAMGIITEVVLLMNAPMLALAGTGELFKHIEPQVRKGIDGLKLITPVVLALFTPIMAYMVIVNKFGTGLANTGLTTEFKLAAQMIAEGMLLVGEAVLMMVAPMGAIAALGYIKGMLGDNVEKGKAAIKLTTDTLVSLYPVIPIFAAAITMGAISVFTGGTGFVAQAAIIASGMLLVSEAVLSLGMPMASIEMLGNQYPNLNGVKKGAEAIKVTATAMTYVEQGLSEMVKVQWDIIESSILSLVGKSIGADLTKLTGDSGFFTQLNTFITAFNQLNIETPNADKVTALSSVSGGIKTIGDAMKNVKTAMDNLPEEFKNLQNGKPLVSYDNKTDKTTVKGATDIKGYFDTFKEPLKELKKFITDFNSSDEFDMGEGISPDRVNAINQSATMITSLNTAIQKVKTVMQGINGAGWETNMATGGIFAAAAGWLGGLTGGNYVGATSSGGNYKSSLGSSFQELENVLADLSTFSTAAAKYSTSGETTNVESLATFITSVGKQIDTLSNTLASKVPTIKTNAQNIGHGIITGIKTGLNGLDSIGGQIAGKIANGIMNNKNTVYNTAKALGTTTYKNFKTGVNPMSESMGWELYYVGEKIDDNKYSLGEKAYQLGKYMADRFKEGNDMHSPGIMARSTEAELGYMSTYFDNAIRDLPNKAFTLASNLTNNFNPSLGMSNLQLPNLTTFKNGLSNIPTTVNNVKDNVTTNFNEMSSNVGTSLNGISSNAQTSYTNIVNTTKNSLNNMKSKTIQNIGNIKTSWKGLQNSLIASAENIRKKTGEKINNLRDNMASFWRKIQNPSLLIQGSAGSPTKTSTGRRAYRPSNVKRGVSSHLGYAGSPDLSKKHNIKNSNLREQLEILLQSFIDGKPVYAGGWDFNWGSSIQNKFKNWKTNFNKYHLDNYLNAGKFENSTFPVKRIGEIAKSYIYDAISHTDYDFYYDSKHGNNPLSIWNSGAFNCWDGAHLVLALANAFGFGGSIGHTSWNGIPHVFANIPGLGVIDSTAIQKQRRFKASGVSYAGGSSRKVETGETNNYNGDININIYTDGDKVKVDGNRLSNRDAKKIIDILGRNPATGR